MTFSKALTHSSSHPIQQSSSGHPSHHHPGRTTRTSSPNHHLSPHRRQTRRNYFPNDNSAHPNRSRTYSPSAGLRRTTLHNDRQTGRDRIHTPWLNAQTEKLRSLYPRAEPLPVPASNSKSPPKLHPAPPPRHRSTPADPLAPKLSLDELEKFLSYAPLPPDPSHPTWMNRCLNCFVSGHLTDKCTGETICLLCLSGGHAAAYCPHRHLPPKPPPNDALVV